MRTAPFRRHGELLTPGLNVDVIDVIAGAHEAAQIGYGDPQSQMVVEYALQRWARGEEDGALHTIRGFIDVTSFYRIVAAAHRDNVPRHAQEA